MINARGRAKKTTSLNIFDTFANKICKLIDHTLPQKYVQFVLTGENQLRLLSTRSSLSCQRYKCFQTGNKIDIKGKPFI